MKLRVGLVGLGSAWDYRHRPALLSLGDRFEVRAVCEQIGLRAKQVAREFGACAVDGYRSLAWRNDIDAILMLSTQWYGVLPLLAACDAGKAVYCAAALDLQAEQAGNLKSRVDASGIAFMAEFPRRHSPATIRLKELIATRLGRVQLVFCHMRLGVEDANQRMMERVGDCPITRELIELVDWCRFVVGKDVRSVTGVSHYQGTHAERVDYRMLSLQFPGDGQPVTNAGTADAASEDIVAQISCGRYLPDGWDEAIAFRRPAGLQVCCEHGVAFVDLPSNLIWFDSAGRHQESLDRDRPVGELMLSQFHRAVTSLVRRRDDLEDAYRAVQVVLAGRESEVTGRRIEMA